MTDYGQVLGIALAFIGTGAGLCWAYLGITALKYLPDADEHDRVYGWTLWWFMEEARYTEPGKQLCHYGWLSFAVSLGAWLGWFALK